MLLPLLFWGGLGAGTPRLKNTSERCKDPQAQRKPPLWYLGCLLSNHIARSLSEWTPHFSTVRGQLYTQTCSLQWGMAPHPGHAADGLICPFPPLHFPWARISHLSAYTQSPAPSFLLRTWRSSSEYNHFHVHPIENRVLPPLISSWFILRVHILGLLVICRPSSFLMSEILVSIHLFIAS